MNYTLTTPYIQSKQKTQVFGLKVTATFDAHSQTVLGFTYSHWPLMTKPEIIKAYLISPYTYEFELGGQKQLSFKILISLVSTLETH